MTSFWRNIAIIFYNNLFIKLFIISLKIILIFFFNNFIQVVITISHKIFKNWFNCRFQSTQKLIYNLFLWKIYFPTFIQINYCPKYQKFKKIFLLSLLLKIFRNCFSIIFEVIRSLSETEIENKFSFKQFISSREK
jgi:hypothetical protein